MVARVTRYRIRPGKVEQFIAHVDSLTSTLDKLEGFHAFFLLRGENPDGRDATAVSLWDTVEHMKSSENDKFYYAVIKTLMGFCESFSPMHVHEVLKSKFAQP
ncbi:MAG TPA: antibiotic biosynthesis monooxygenase [Candidatus Acidoferrales bacterium]|nr:antibiotic biosynthesis monooxygenase [Candidatus Acidoferrales bacterium]